MNYTEEKSLIRAQKREDIKKLTNEARQKAAIKVTDLIVTNILQNINNVINIACYWPTKHEISSKLLIEFLLDHNKNCYLPVINTNQTLDFIKYTNNTQLIKNKYNILEPMFNVDSRISIIDLDLIFMPLVAFDKLGHRIGSGAGFYDRSLVNRSNFCKLIGMAYSIQEASCFASQVWDINLDIIVTEKQIFICDK